MEVKNPIRENKRTMRLQHHCQTISDQREKVRNDDNYQDINNAQQSENRMLKTKSG